MDAVITFVDGLDPLWQADYAAWHGGKAPLAKRFRDWGTLPYLLRGIERFMPFVEKVHLVVARESQVPQWVSDQEVHVVLHRDIIPEEFLPMFNSCSIEMFLHRIPGLSEEFLYFNDDMFPVAPSQLTALNDCIRGLQQKDEKRVKILDFAAYVADFKEKQLERGKFGRSLYTEEGNPTSICNTFMALFLYDFIKRELK